MPVILIKETIVKNFKEKIILIIKQIFNKVDIIDKNNKKILILPIKIRAKYNKKLINRLTKKIVRYLEEYGVNNVVLSNNLKNIDILKNYLYSENINILDGRYLFKVLSKEIIEYIIKLRNEKIQTSEVCILVNDYNSINKEIIINIAKNVKTINIVTNNINRFKKIDNYLYKEYGILLNISNNKKTSLLRSKIILNIDFPEEIINRYKINTEAVIINILNIIKIHSKKFNGININYFKIDMPVEYKIEGFLDEEIYESIIINYNYEQVLDKIKHTDIKINSLIGNRGIISKQEFI